MDNEMLRRIENEALRCEIFRNTITMCLEYPSYYVGIFVNTKRFIKIATEELLNIISCVENNTYSIRCQNGYTGIYFKNGSRIDIFGGARDRHSERYATVVYDKALDGKYVNACLFPCLIDIERNGKLLPEQIKEIRF